MVDRQGKEITGLGYDERLGGLDLSGCPSVQQRLGAASWEDGDWLHMDDTGKGHGSRELKNFIAEQTAEKEASTVHVAGAQFTIQFVEGVYRAEGSLNGQRHRITANDRDTLIAKLMKLANQNAARDLTGAERLEVARLCQGDRKLDGINAYLHHALGDRADDPNLLADESMLGVLDDCALFTWVHSRPDFHNSAAWETFMDRYIDGRPLTHDLLDAAWSAFERSSTAKRVRTVRKTEPAPTPAQTAAQIADELENLSDEEVNLAYSAQVRESARSARQG